MKNLSENICLALVFLCSAFGATDGNERNDSVDFSEEVLSRFAADQSLSSKRLEQPRSLSINTTLECFCDVCDESNFVCETNGACFVSRENFNGSYRIFKR